MKKLILILFIGLLGFSSRSQQPSYRDLNLEGVKVGEKMPDIPLGTVINNYTGKTRFADFKGKLIILDVWSTYCESCMEFFPHMEDLQKRFGDRIQIFLVNRFETQEQIDKRFKKLANKKYKFPNLPSIVNAEALAKLFPHEGDPYHIWIDGNGIVRVRGPINNTLNEQKILDVLAGNPIDYIKSGLKYNTEIPFYSLMHDKAAAAVQYVSFFTRFTDSLAYIWGDGVFNKKNIISGTVRNTYLNSEIMDLYLQTVPDEVIALWRKIIYPEEFRTKVGVARRVSLLVKDSLRYTSMFLGGDKLTDVFIRAYRYCYEQIVPGTIPETTRKKNMLEDLNRYFEQLFGTEGKIIQRKVKCYSLVHTSTVDKLHTPIKGIKSWKLAWLISSQFQHLSAYSKELLIDETGITDNVYCDLPNNIQSMEALKKALQVFDLDIIQIEREWPLLEIRESGKK